MDLLNAGIDRDREPRTRINRIISLFYPPLGLLQVRIRDISNSGLYIKLGNIRLNLYSDAEILAPIDDTVIPMRATIVRVSEHGAGLQFINPDLQQVKRLITGESLFTAASEIH